MKKAKKKKSAKKALSTKKEKSPSLSLGLNPEVVKGIWSVVFFAVAILVTLSLFGNAGDVGDYLKQYLQEGIGWGVYAIPVVFVAFAVAFVASWTLHSSRVIFISALVFVCSLVAIFSAFAFSPDAQDATEKMIDTGGYIGYGIAYFPLDALEKTATIVLFLTLAIVALIVGFNVSLGDMVKKWLERRRKKREQEREEDEDEEEEIEGHEEVSVEESATSEQKQEKKKSKKPSEEKPLKAPSFTPAESGGATAFQLPPFDLLELDSKKPMSGDIQANALKIKQTLKTFGIEVDVGEVSVGPTVTQYTMKPREGTKLSRITALSNDLALALAAEALRIEAPIPGKSLVGIEMPNKVKAVVRLRNLIERQEFQNAGQLAIALGRDVSGKAMYSDLATMPHLLIAGSTGAGKTIALTSVILSLLYRNTPEQLRLLLVDPKRVEFTVYANIPHLLAPVVTENAKAINALKWAVSEMERRFDLLGQVGARDIIAYHKNKQTVQEHGPLPYLVIIIDELADLMSAKGKEVEVLVVRIAQLARAAGIHLILATQRPSVEVITGTIKANLPARMAFQVASQIDSRTILDMAGAEKLIGKGDMLFLGRGDSKPMRIQGTFVEDSETKKVADHLRSQIVESVEQDVAVDNFTTPTSEDVSQPMPPPQQQSPSVDFDDLDASAEDDLYEEAKQIVIKSKKASASLLQRRLRVGYARAARLLDLLEENNVIGPADGSKPRDVYVQDQDQEQDNMMS